MIRYSTVVLFICVCTLNSAKAKVVMIQPGNCVNNAYVDFFRCMIQCYTEQYGITGKIEDDYCSNGVQVIIEGSDEVSYTGQDVKEAIQCVTEKCQSAVPESICGDDSSPIVTNLPDDVQDSVKQTTNSGKKTGQLKDVSGILSASDDFGEYSDEPGEYTDEPACYEYIRNEDASSGQGQLEISSGSQAESFAFAAGPQSDAFASASGLVATGLAPAAGDSDDCEEPGGVEIYDSKSSTSNNAATSDSSNTPVSDATSGSTVSGLAPQFFSTDGTASATTSETYGSASSAATDSTGTSMGGSSTDSFSTGSTPDRSVESFAFASGSQSKSIANASGPQSDAFASASGPVTKGLTPEAGNYSDELGGVESDDSKSSTSNNASAWDSSNTSVYDATSGSTVSGVTPPSFSTDGTSSTTTSGTSGFASSASSTLEAVHRNTPISDATSGNTVSGVTPPSFSTDGTSFTTTYGTSGFASSASSTLEAVHSNTPVSDATSDSTVSGVTPPSFSTDGTSSTTTSGTSGFASSASSTLESVHRNTQVSDTTSGSTVSGVTTPSFSTDGTSSTTTSRTAGFASSASSTLEAVHRNTPASDATSGSTVSGVTPLSFSTDGTSFTTTSGTSGSASSAATDSTGTSTEGSSTDYFSTGSTPDGSLDNGYEYEENAPEFIAVPKTIDGSGNNFQSASGAVAVASSGSNFAKSSFGGLNYATDDYNFDYYNDTYDYYDNYTRYYYYNGAYYNDNDTDYYNDNNTLHDYPRGGNATAFAGVQGVNLKTDSKQYQGINVENGSTSVEGIVINQNPIIETHQTNGKNTGLLSNTFVRNLGINQNPTGSNNGVGVNANGQNAGPFTNAPIEMQQQNQNDDQLQSIFAQLQSLPIRQNQGTINKGGAIATSGQSPVQFVNSMQSQGVYSNPWLQQYQNNPYGSVVSTNQQYLSQSANTPLKPNAYPSNGASIGTISLTGSGNSGQMQPITANTQTSYRRSNPFVVSSSATTGAGSREGSSRISQVFAGNYPVPSQSGIFGPSLNSPQTYGGGIYSASNLGSSTAGSFPGSSVQNQGRSENVPFLSQFFKRSSLGNRQDLNIPQYNGNAAQTKGGGIWQAGASNFASGVSNNGAYQGFISGPRMPINSQSFSGNIPTNQGAVPSAGSSAYAASFANTGSSTNAGSLEQGGIASSANVQSYM